MSVEDEYYGRAHSIFEKDVFRIMKADKIIEKAGLIKNKNAGERTLLEYNNNKYKTKS